MCRNHNYRHSNPGFLAVLVGFSILATASAEQAAYDRAWWNGAGIDERTQFMAGYIDCAFYDLGDRSLSNAKWYVIEPEITEYYSTHLLTHKTVPSLIAQFGSGALPADPGGEAHSGKHGIFDGDYWWQLSSPERIGFVKGYFACHESVSRGHGLHDHQVEWYVDKLSDFYCFTGKTCANEHISESKRIPEKIATILQRLQTQ